MSKPINAERIIYFVALLNGRLEHMKETQEWYRTNMKGSPEFVNTIQNYTTITTELYKTKHALRDLLGHANWQVVLKELGRVSKVDVC